MNKKYEELIAENLKLKRALAGLIPWTGILPGGPPWATPEAEARNRATYAEAFKNACNCFPENHGSQQEIIESN